MRRPVRMMAAGLLAGALSVMLTGCSLFKPIESLYALPALPEEYAQLQDRIKSVMDETGAEYDAISYGSNTSTIQLLDMDGDGKQELAAVFLRALNAEEKPLRVCLFRKDREGDYQLAYTLQGDGLSINSVNYEDVTGDGVRELIVSWQVSAKVQNLSVYQLLSGGAIELMSTSYNESYLTVDLDRDSCKEIVILQQGSSETENNRAEYYRYQDAAMVMTSSANLSAPVRDVTGAKAGRLADGESSIYITCETESGTLTDILTLKDGVLCNVTLKPELGYSDTLRTYTEIGATDINYDGVIELPVPVPALNIADPEAAPRHFFLHWKQYDSDGKENLLDLFTYHSASDGWYFTMPEHWEGKVTVERDDSRSVRGERAVVFYYWPDPVTTKPAPFLTIYRLTGENRFSRAKVAGRVILLSDSSAFYCASLNPDVWDCGLSSDAIAARFRLIAREWSAQ